MAKLNTEDVTQLARVTSENFFNPLKERSDFCRNNDSPSTFGHCCYTSRTCKRLHRVGLLGLLECGLKLLGQRRSPTSTQCKIGIPATNAAWLTVGLARI
jgi:hypothetical protein